MIIQVLGSGCPSCKKMFEATKKIAEELNIKTEVEYIPDVSKMIEIGVMTSPVLLVDGSVALAGAEMNEYEIKKVLSGDSGKEDCCGGCHSCSCGN